MGNLQMTWMSLLGWLGEAARLLTWHPWNHECKSTAALNCSCVPELTSPRLAGCSESHPQQSTGWTGEKT